MYYYSIVLNIVVQGVQLHGGGGGGGGGGEVFFFFFLKKGGGGKKKQTLRNFGNIALKLAKRWGRGCVVN